MRTYDVDLTDPEAVAAFIDDVRARCPAPTHLVHLPALRVVNAKFKNFDFERFALDFNVQVQSALRLCQAFVPAMAKARFGRVLFMLTSYLIGPPPKNVAAYVTAKSALAGLAKSLAADYAPFGVTVNCVAPYMMETKFLSDTSDLVVQMSAEANPMKRNARVEDVVPAMAFLLSDEAGFITGATLPVTAARRCRERARGLPPGKGGREGARGGIPGRPLGQPPPAGASGRLFQPLLCA